MGGRIFKKTTPLSVDDVAVVKLALSNVLVNDLSIVDYEFIGSSMGKGPCGDIDVAVCLGFEALDIQRAKVCLAAKTLFGEENVKRIGSLVSICFKNTKFGSFHQVDLIPCKNTDHAQWLMNGLFRHMLFALLAKEETERTAAVNFDAKVTLAVPDGLQITANGLVVLSRTTDPQTILSFLGFDESVAPDDVLTFKDLVNVVAYERPYILDRYPAYISHLLDKRGYADALKIIQEARDLIPYVR